MIVQKRDSIRFKLIHAELYSRRETIMLAVWHICYRNHHSIASEWRSFGNKDIYPYVAHWNMIFVFCLIYCYVMS